MISIAVAMVVLYHIFPHNGVFQDLVAACGFFGIIPYLSAHVIIGKSNAELGYTAGNMRSGAILSVLFFILMIVLFLLLTRFASSWFNYADMPQVAIDYFWVFVAYNGIIALYAIVYSLFLQGFIINGMRAELGSAAIGVSLIAFALISGNGIAQIDAYIGVLFASLIAYYSYSIYYALLFVFFTGIAVNGISLILLQ